MSRHRSTPVTPCDAVGVSTLAAAPAPDEPPSRGPDAARAIDVSVVARAFRRLQARLERLARHLSDVCDEVDAAAKALEDLVGRLAGVSSVTPRKGARRSPEDDRMMRAEAEAGAPSLDVRRLADGSGEVSVSGRRSFSLPPKLATVLELLLAPGDTADDGLLGWRTPVELAAALGKRVPGSVGARAVSRLVYKLRRCFRDAGENWRLIQTNRERGVRVAVRR
jgi:hypothetical protein